MEGRAAPSCPAAYVSTVCVRTAHTHDRLCPRLCTLLCFCTRPHGRRRRPDSGTSGWRRQPLPRLTTPLSDLYLSTPIRSSLSTRPQPTLAMQCWASQGSADLCPTAGAERSNTPSGCSRRGRKISAAHFPWPKHDVKESWSQGCLARHALGAFLTLPGFVFQLNVYANHVLLVMPQSMTPHPTEMRRRRNWFRISTTADHLHVRRKTVRARRGAA